MLMISLKVVTFLVVFFATLSIFGKIMNKGHSNMTKEMSEASLPVVIMKWEEGQYNRLFGYTMDMDTAICRESLTVLGEKRELSFSLNPYGQAIRKLEYELRSTDKSRLIENGEIVYNFQTDGSIAGNLAFKDLLEKNQEYEWILLVTLGDGRVARYYTRVIWGDDFHLTEQLQFIKDFHNRTYDKEAAKELTKYLEPNRSLESNSSFHRVTIHSSLKQVTWGDLPIKEEVAPVITVRELTGQTALMMLDYRVSTDTTEQYEQYNVKEYFRVRYTKDRMYLLDYERIMNQLVDPQKMYANNKFLLGITDENVPLAESPDGNMVAFEASNSLFGYDCASNKLTSIFRFQGADQFDERTLHDDYKIKILDIPESGNVVFAVYGYMNRGTHEGECGLSLYTFNVAHNTIEEDAFIPYDKGAKALIVQVDQLLYYSGEHRLYLTLDGKVYGVNLIDRSVEELINLDSDEMLKVSSNGQIIVWQESDNCLHIMNLANHQEKQVSVGVDEIIHVLNFVEEDVIYGIASNQDISRDELGQLFTPMYKICIANDNGEVVKEYEQPDVYVTGCHVVDNQITLHRMKRNGSSFVDMTDDQIMNNVVEETGKNFVVPANIDLYEQYIQIQVKNNIDSKTIKMLTPKEVILEAGQNVVLEEKDATDGLSDCFFVNGSKGLEAICFSPAKAINMAYDFSGVVTNAKGETVWLKGNRVTKNQIMKITENSVTEDKNSLAVCLDTVLQFEGYLSDASTWLREGQSAIEILQNNMTEYRVMDLTDCTLDAVLYYVNMDIPVLATVDHGEAVFNSKLLCKWKNLLIHSLVILSCKN